MLFYRTSNRQKRRPKGGPKGWAFLLAALGGLGITAVLFPAGTWGQPVNSFLDLAFGAGRYVLPLAMLYAGLKLLFSPSWPRAAWSILLSALVYFLGLTVGSLFGQAA